MIEDILPDQQEREIFFAVFRKPLKKSLTLLSSRFSQEKLLAYAKKYERDLTKPLIDLKNSRYIDRENRELALWKTLLHLVWALYLQEVAASIPATCLTVPQGWLVLDMCASPWWKSIQLAQQDCLVWSNDVSRSRLAALSQNIQRTSSYNTLVSNYDGVWFGQNMPWAFDAILLDAPCSGEWTSFKSSSAYDWRHPWEIQKIAWLQWQLIQSAVSALAPGGELVYSTCTLNTTENEAIVAQTLQTYPDLSFVSTKKIWASWGLVIDGLAKEQSDGCLRCRPHTQKTGWFFVSRFRKAWVREEASITKKKKWQQSGFVFSKKLQGKVRDFLMQWWVEKDENKLFVQYGKDIYVTHQKAAEILYHKMYQVGVPFAREVRDGYTLHHGAGTVFGARATQQVLDLTHTQAQDYAHHQDIVIDVPNGEYMLRREWLWIGVTKVINWVTKNRFMKW